MSRVNLLPPEVRKARRSADLVRRLRFFGLCALLLLGGLYGIRTLQLFLIRGDIEEARARQAIAQARLDELADVAAARDGVEVYRSYVAQILAGEVLWSEQLLKVAGAVPPGFSMTSMSLSADASSESPVIGSVTFSGSATRFVDARAWLSRIASEEGWANGWLGSLQGAAGGPVTLSGSIDLTRAAISARGGGEG